LDDFAHIRNLSLSVELQERLREKMAQDTDYLKVAEIEEISAIQGQLDEKTRDFAARHGITVEQANEQMKAQTDEIQRLKIEEENKSRQDRESLEKKVYHLIKKRGARPDNFKELNWFTDTWNEELRKLGWSGNSAAVMTGLIEKGEQEGWQ
jgi:hypothetical protein